MFAVASPFTHVKNKETEGSEDDGSDLLPVHRQMVPLSLVLQAADRQGFRSEKQFASPFDRHFCCLNSKKI